MSLIFKEAHLSYMKAFIPFYDAYVLLDAKEQTDTHKTDCIIDRRYTKLQFMVFAMILRDSSPETLEANLRQPGQWIAEALKAQEARSVQTIQKKVEEAAPAPIRNPTRLQKSLMVAERVIDDKLGSNLLKESLTQDVVTDDKKAQIALLHQSEDEVREALKEAYEILFEAEEDDLPLYSTSRWQSLIDLRYRFKNIQEA